MKKILFVVAVSFAYVAGMAQIDRANLDPSVNLATTSGSTPWAAGWRPILLTSSTPSTSLTLLILMYTRPHAYA